MVGLDEKAGEHVASIRTAIRDGAHGGAVAHLITNARGPWEDWREDPVISELLWMADSHLNVLRNSIAPALQVFVRTRDSARGLACVYLVQALVAAELEAAEAEQVEPR